MMVMQVAELPQTRNMINVMAQGQVISEVQPFVIQVISQRGGNIKKSGIHGEKMPDQQKGRQNKKHRKENQQYSREKDNSEIVQIVAIHLP